MAALEFDLVKADLGLAIATAKTALQIIAASTNKVKVNFIEISFDGVSGTDKPILAQVMRQTTAIGGSPSTVTPVKSRNGEAGTIQTTAKASAGGTEPTSSDIYRSLRIHPQGNRVIPGPFIVEQSDRLGVVLTSDTVLNVTVTAKCEE